MSDFVLHDPKHPSPIRSADEPLDGFDGLTASMLGALSLSKRVRPYTPFGVA